MTWYIRHGRHDGVGGPTLDDFDTFDDALEYAQFLDDESDEYWRDPIEDDRS